MLVGDPVRVNKPPALEPKATGINNLDGNVPALHAAVIDTGSKAATVPVLLTKPESKPEPSVTITSNLDVLLPASFTNFWPAIAVHPVLDKPSPIINNPAIIITVGLLNPLRVSSKFKIPLRNKANIEIMATMSGENFPQTNKAIVNANIMPKVNMFRELKIYS